MTSKRARLKGVTDVIKCESCGWDNPLHAAFCTNCGNELDRADMSLSTDMSGSDDLSLDGSDSNLIVEAAKASSERQRMGQKEETTAAAPEDVGHSISEESTSSAEAQPGAELIENRATVQLTGEVADIDEEDMNHSESDEGSDQNEEEEKQHETTADERENQNTEKQAGLLAMQSAVMPKTEEANAEDLKSVDAETSSEDNFTYVAFDDGIPEEDDDDVDDSSMRSLDVGVESLSLDDSLLLDEKQARNAGIAADSKEDIEEIEPGFVQNAGAVSFYVRNRNGDTPPRAVDREQALILGRSDEADLQFEDVFSSPAHCQIEVSGAVLELTDLNSLNGTWLRLLERQSIATGSQIRMGGRVFSVKRNPKAVMSSPEDDDGTKAFVERNPESQWSLTAIGLSVPIPKSGIRVGRLTGTLVFEDDAQLSSVHACLIPIGDELEFRDFNTKSGSWLRVDRPTKLVDGDEILVGETRFTIEKN